MTPFTKNVLTWYISMYHVIGFKQTHSIKNITLKVAKNLWVLQSTGKSNRPFLSSLVPLCPSESKCETILIKMTLICIQMKLYEEVIFI